MTSRFALVVCGLVLLSARDASAQRISWGDRLFINVNVGAQPRSVDDATHFGFDLFNETGSVDVARTVKAESFIDVTVGSMPLRNWGLAVSFIQLKAKSDGTLTASLPDPAFYDSPQAFAGTVSALEHQETWVAALVVYQLPRIYKVDLRVLAGPAIARVRHEVVTDVAVDSGSGQVSASLAILSRDLLGTQAGVDARYLFSKQLGVGAYVRFNAAKGNLSPTLKADLGGVQYGGGLRVRF